MDSDCKPNQLVSVGYRQTWQELNAGVLDQLRIGNRARTFGRIVIQMPVRPSPVRTLVVDQLEQSP